MKKMFFLTLSLLILGVGCRQVAAPVENGEEPLPPAVEPTKTSFEVYFIDPDLQEFDCSVVDFEKRTIDATEDVEVAAILELIDGPESEWAQTSMPEGTTLKSLWITDGVAYVDFGSTDITKWSGGSCHVISLRSQIEHTLLQFEEVDEVVISVNGETEEILQP